MSIMKCFFTSFATFGYKHDMLKLNYFDVRNDMTGATCTAGNAYLVHGYPIPQFGLEVVIVVLSMCDVFNYSGFVLELFFNTVTTN